MSQLHTSITTRKLPGDGTTRSVAFHLQGIDTPSERSYTSGTTGQAAALKNANFDFGKASCKERATPVFR